MQSHTPCADQKRPEIETFTPPEREEDLQRQLEGHPYRDRAERRDKTVRYGIPRNFNRGDGQFQTPLASRAQGQQYAYDGDRDQRCDQAVFNGCGAFLIFNQTN